MIRRSIKDVLKQGKYRKFYTCLFHALRVNYIQRGNRTKQTQHFKDERHTQTGEDI